MPRPHPKDSNISNPVSLSTNAGASAESATEIALDVAAVRRLGVVPKLLQILCTVTGMRFAAVARVTEQSWTACAIKDEINFGLVPGDQLPIETTLCRESRAARASVIIDRASTDARYQNHHTPKLYQIESYISVPIIMASGRYFGNLCALDPAPAAISDSRTVDMFQGFADLIAAELEAEFARQLERSALQDARAAAEFRDQFIAILGHDLRNPLQAIYATSQVLERRLPDPVFGNMAARISVNVRRMSSLIDDVLDFARGRLGSGIGVDIKEVADVERALVGVVEELQDARPERQILFDVSVDKSVYCDVGRVQQVTSNLIANALTHGSASSPVKVSVTTTDTDLVIDVWNDGEPIALESIPKIFEPFWRQATSSERQGLGLGLYICSQIVRAHGGKLSVTSSRDDGTQFIVKLPLVH